MAEAEASEHEPHEGTPATGGMRHLARFAVAAASAGVGVALLGDTWPLADVVSPLLVHMIAFGAVASLALLVERRAGLLLGLGAILILAGHSTVSFARCCGAAGDVSATAANPPLKILLMNTWHEHPAPDRLVGALGASGADVAVLVEFGPNKQHLLGALRATFPHQVSCAAAWSCAMAIVSRVPIEASGYAPHQAGVPQMIVARVKSKSRAQGDDAILTIVGTHVWRPSRDPWRHASEMRGLAGFLRTIGGPLVLAGDLNAAPWSASYRRLLAHTGMTATARMLPNWPAWPVAVPQVAIDHILVSSDLAIEGSGVGRPAGSDHLPVWAHIRPGPAAATARGSGFAAPLLFGRQLFADLGGEHGAARNLRR